jgi:Spy/CpxP family protein refolding chaperone
MMGGPGGIGMLFQNPEFAKILELTSEQTTSLQRVLRESAEEMRTQMQETMQQGQQGGAPPNPDQMRQRMEKFIDEAQVKVDKVLNPQQQTKVRELAFQMSGGLNAPFLNERTLQVLKLTDAQKDQVRKIVADRDAEFRNAMQQGFDFRNATPEEREKFRTDMESRGKKFADQVATILTPEQKAKAEALTAEAPALRERLGIPPQGPPGQRGPGPQGRQGQGRGQQGESPVYTPGDNSWRPGQGDTPEPTPTPGRRRSGFPRSE